MTTKIHPTTSSSGIEDFVSPIAEERPAVMPETPAPANTPIESQAPTLLSIVSKMSTISKLSDDAKKYIESMKKIFSDAAEPITVTPFSTEKIEGVCCVHESGNKYAINLLFSESNTALDNTPAAMQAKECVDRVMASDPTLRPRQTIVVSPVDYPKVGQMASFISNFFKTLADTEVSHAAELTIDSMKGIKFSIITNIDSVRRFVDRHSPHGVRSRDDIGVLVCIETPTITATGQRVIETKELMAVTGYTRILDPQNPANGAGFLPLVTITDIVCPISDVNLTALAFPVAGDAFIAQSLWLQPYKGCNKTSPNLGNLCVVDGKPAPYTNIDQMRMVVRQYMAKPLLAIDISEGRARCHGIDGLLDNPQAILSNMAHKFFKCEAPANISWVNYLVYNFTGHYLDKGVYKDTRCVDYLDLAPKVADVRTIAPFLVQPNLPNVLFDSIKNIHSGETTQALYNTGTVVIGSGVIAWMISLLNQANIKLGYDIPASGNVNIDQLLGPGVQNDYKQFAGITNGYQINNGYNLGFGNIYRI